VSRGAFTFGSPAASSPETISRPIESGSPGSSSEAAAQASATPRPFGVAGTKNAPQPSLPARPSFSASWATRTPARPPGPDQMRTMRSASIASSSEVTMRAPFRRAWRTHRSTIGALSASGTSPSTATTCASAIAESGRR